MISYTHKIRLLKIGEKMKIRRQISKNGTSLCVNLPTDVLKYMEVTRYSPIILTVNADKSINIKKEDGLDES